MPAPALTTRDKVLIVEGYSDLVFYAELLEYLGKEGQVFIQHFNGKSDLETKLETFINPGLLAAKRKIAVIVDADMDGSATARRLETALHRLTGQTVSAGTWTVGQPNLGLFVVPACNQAGEIETLVWDNWAADAANGSARHCVETFRDCMAQAGMAALSPAKGLVGSLLAIRNDDDPRLGPGARAGLFDFSHTGYEPLKEFLKGF